MKFQDIILAENRKLSRQLLSLTQLLYDQRHQASQAVCAGCERHRGQQEAALDLQRLSEGLAQRVAELECENARLSDELLRASADKEARLKEQHLAQHSLKAELRSAQLRLKEFECEIARLRHEAEQERARKSEGEALSKTEAQLRQAYDKALASLRSQKEHHDRALAGQERLYSAIDRLRAELGQREAAAAEAAAEAKRARSEVKRAMAEKSEKDALIKSKLLFMGLTV